MPTRPATSKHFLENGLPLCIFCLLTFITFHEYITGGIVPFGRDDALIYQPAREFIVDTIRDGHLPLWCPYIGMGYPIAAEGECGLFNPFLPLFFMLPFYKAYILSIIICYPLFAFFLYRLARTWGLAREGALLCAVAVTYAGAYLLWQGHSPIITTLLWFPLMLLFLIKACRGEGRRNIAVAAILYALMIFSGNPQFTYGATIFAALFLLTIGDGGNPFRLRRILASAFPAFILGAMLGAVQLIPLFELTRNSERAAGLFDPSMGSLNWNELMALGAPILLSPHGVNWAPEAANGYIGYAATLLALFGLFSFPRKTYTILLGTVLVVLSFGGVTNLGLFRVASRMLFFLGFLGGLLAGYGLDVLTKYGWRDASTRLRLLAACVLLILLALLSGAYFVAPGLLDVLYLLVPVVITLIALLIFLLTPKAYRAISTALIIFIALAGSVYIYGVRASTGGIPLADLARPPQLADVLGRLNNDGRIWIMLGERDNDPAYFYRSVYGPRALLYRLATPEDETPLFLNGLLRFQRMAIASITGITGKTRGPIPHADTLAAVKYIAVTSDAAASLGYTEAYRGDDASPPFVIEELPGYSGLAFFIFPRTGDFSPPSNDGPDIGGFVMDDSGAVDSIRLQGPRAEIAAQPAPTAVQVIEPFKNPNRMSIKYSAPVNSFLFISQMYYPGWRAYLNGRPAHLYRAYGIFCGVVVDKPDGVVELIYRPSTWLLGAAISILSLLILCLGVTGLFSKKVSLTPKYPLPPKGTGHHAATS